ncbi:hypothetical protein [Tumebacillus flagellatus]|uniref:hypothetical protein n=1 Tax=Tumebacillus flagellatus TaxID=1157490 RepID=UPI0013780442|nr:hypothetical protein [Tumebacillus flagellatus]
MNEELMKEVSDKFGVNYEGLREIIECERKQVHKKRRSIMGDLKEIVEKNIKEVAEV